MIESHGQGTVARLLFVEHVGGDAPAEGREVHGPAGVHAQGVALSWEVEPGPKNLQ